MQSPKGLILCTEDDPDTRELIVFTLTHAGYESVCVDSAEQAVAAAQRQRFDLYLMDSRLPGISGVELCKTLREFDSATPILFYSGAAYESDKERARAAGAQGYLVKPADGDDLVAEVARLITGSKVVIPVAVIPPPEPKRRVENYSSTVYASRDRSTVYHLIEPRTKQTLCGLQTDSVRTYKKVYLTQTPTRPLDKTVCMTCIRLTDPDSSQRLSQ